MKNKILIIVGIFLALVVAGVLAVRFFSGEDSWICENGEWVRHGNPSAAKPLENCPSDSAAKNNLNEDNGTEPIEQEDHTDLIKVSNPQANATVTSPLEITGEARGIWYFEASFPVELRDGDNNLLAQGVAEAQGDWMTDNFVPFKATLNFISPQSQDGALILYKDNPSGLPEKSKELKIPVKIAKSEGVLVKAFFSMGGMTGNDCERVLPVTRTVPKTQAIGRVALEELLKGPTKEEEDQKYITMINSGVRVRSLTIENGIARVDFSRALEKNVGGSCRVMAIRSQITETLKQFNTVKQVVISVEGRTEDVLQP